MKPAAQFLAATAVVASGAGIFAILSDAGTDISLEDFDIDPAFVNVEDSTGHTSCDFHITETGALTIRDAACVFVSPSGAQKASCMAHAPYQGTTDDGNWACSVPFPINSEGGDWDILIVDIRDSDFNTARFTKSDLDGNTPTPYPSSVDLTSTAPDTTDPVITGFTISPSEQGVISGDGSITCTVTVTDNVVDGMLYTNCTFDSPTGASPPLSCTAHEGIDDAWSCSVVVPQSSEIGTWDLVEIRASDVVHNEVRLDNTAVAALPGDTSFDITVAVCGNDILEAPEECDGTDDAACPAACLGNCTCPGVVVIDLDVTTYIAGLDKPWDIAWLPNGTVLVTERPGPLNVYVDGVGSSPFTISPTDLVSTGGEGGMMGLEVDPLFATNGYVYVCMASDLDGPNDVRVVRFELDTPLGDSLISRTDIVTGMPHNDGSNGRHSGCRPRFGPDGFLWVGTGDAAVGTAPQDDNSLGGKVLRVDRTGAAATGNPGGELWYSKGHRNIQGMAFRLSDDLGVSAEHGPSIDDELNLLVTGNFGWDPIPGYNESVPMTDLTKFPSAVEAIWSSGSPTLALSGAGFIEGSNWNNWDGVLSVATLKDTHLHIYFIDDQGQVTSEVEAIDDQGRLRSPRLGPDGLLYVTTDGGGSSGEVLQVTPVLGGAGGACNSKTPDLTVTNGWISSSQQSGAVESLVFSAYVRSASAAATSVVTLATSAATSYSANSVLVRFDLDGFFDLWDEGSSYCDKIGGANPCANDIPWVVDTWYKITINANVTTETYTVTVGECDDTPVTLFTDAAFRASAPSADLDFYNLNHVSSTIDIEGVVWTPGSCDENTCADFDPNSCGFPPDGCGGPPLNCGSCTLPDVCDSGFQCCTPSTTVCTDPDPDYECGDWSDGCGGTVNCDTGGQTCDERVSGEICDGGGQCIETGDFPSVATTGITDYWCPRWDTLKRDISADLEIDTVTQSEEYYDITGNGNAIHFNANGGTVRCVRVTSQQGTRMTMNWPDGNFYGGLAEDIHLRAQPAPTTNAMMDSGADAQTMRRMLLKPTSGDCMQGAGFFWQDSMCDGRDQNVRSGDPHVDGIQSSGGCGPLFFIHNTMIMEDAVDFGRVCSATAAGFCSNAAWFVQGSWAPGNHCGGRRVQSYVVRNNFISGGLSSDRWSNNYGPIRNTSFTDNIFETGRFKNSYCSYATTGYTQTTTPTLTEPGQDGGGDGDFCFERDNNRLSTGPLVETVESGCAKGNVYNDQRGVCGQILDVPITTISGHSLSASSCTVTDSACDNIDITANVSTNETPRAQFVLGSVEGIDTLLWSSSGTGSFRWRYSCDGASGNTTALPCSRETCTYEDDGADLWYHYSACDGNSSCTMTDVCDFATEGAGTYTVKVYAEAGPGAAFRPSTHKELTFTVNP